MKKLLCALVGVVLVLFFCTATEAVQAANARVLVRAENADEATMERLVEILWDRIHYMEGIVPVFQWNAENRLITIDVPGLHDPSFLSELISRPGVLEFRPIIKSYFFPPEPERRNYLTDEEFAEARARWEEPAEALKKEIFEIRARIEGTGEILLDKGWTSYWLGKTLLATRKLKDARPDANALGRETVRIFFEEDEAKAFEEMTKKFLGRRLAVLLDDEVLNLPVVSEPVTDGAIMLIGRSGAKETAFLAALLRFGALPAEIRILDFDWKPERTVPSESRGGVARKP